MQSGCGTADVFCRASIKVGHIHTMQVDSSSPEPQFYVLYALVVTPLTFAEGVIVYSHVEICNPQTCVEKILKPGND